jgi:hypothetical protein
MAQVLRSPAAHKSQTGGGNGLSHQKSTARALRVRAELVTWITDRRAAGLHRLEVKQISSEWRKVR